MKKACLFLTALVLLSGTLLAQRVVTDDYDNLKVNYRTPNVTVSVDNYITLGMEGAVLGGELGAPALPVLGSLIEVPVCTGMEVTVENAVYDTVTLPQGQLLPLQPARSKSGRELPFAYDAAVYATDAYYSRPLAEVTPLGIGRDRHYAMLNFSPVSVNPVSGKMIVCRSADVTVHYQGSDAGATQKLYERYYTPAFSLGTTLNNLVSGSKAVRATAPVRMVIMAPQRLQCTALSEFADWKRSQGLLVDILYVDNGLSASTMAAQLQQMYDEASATAPAPTYLLLVGDHEQLRAFNSSLPSNNVMHTYNYQLDDHITDLYYVTWTDDDILPDCYQGRFSATDTSTLRGIIQKTLYYERYQFADDSYLSRAVLVAGVDNGYGIDYYDNAWRCADPTMDYIASYYVNADNGFDSLIYYKNDADHAPDGVTVTGTSTSNSAGTALRSIYNGGVGWINYSAHGDWDEWSIPAFRVSHVNNMTNNNMPSFMIGNCCLSNHFDNAICFGEALLRKSNRAGAVAYIGATNSTFWNHDFYWSVGYRSNIIHNMMLNYDANRRGMYDNLFHTHGEDLSQWMVTAGKIVVSGNMSVNRIAGTSSDATSFVEYYWEIYELMGDPSLMPWLGRATDMSTPSVEVYSDMVVVTTVPGAYVAVVSMDNSHLVGAAYADNDGYARVPVDGTDLTTCKISITAQGYKPYSVAFSSHQVGLADAGLAAVSVNPNPASTSTEVYAPGLRRVTVLNMMGQQLHSVDVAADRCTLPLDGLSAGLYLLRIECATGTTVRKVIKN